MLTMATTMSKKLVLIQFSSSDMETLRWRPEIRQSALSFDAFQILLNSFLQERFPERPLAIKSVSMYDETSSKFQNLVDLQDSLQKILSDSRPLHLHVDLQPEKNNDNHSPESFPLLKGRHFPLDNGLPLGSSQENGFVLHIQEQENANLGTGLISWDGSVVLAKYFELHPSVVQNKRVLEVGSGTGIVGLSNYFLGAKRVLLTDLSYSLPNLQRNILKNQEKNADRVDSDWKMISTGILDWKDPKTYPKEESGEGYWDVIVGSDVIWLEELVPPLIQTLEACANENTVIYISHQTRSLHTDKLFFSLLSQQFQFEKVSLIILFSHHLLSYNLLTLFKTPKKQVPRDELHPEYSPSEIHIFRAKKKRNTTR
jgi:predicted nicotinamide N-methyase